MIVHNYYSDILSSLYTFLNNEVLSTSNQIQHVQYNLGNATSMLEYRDSYTLPSAIIKYESLEPWSSMPISPRTFQIGTNLMKNQTDRFEAIYNETKGISLDIQMQYYNLITSISINCKSQMQALNVSHEISQRMPMDRMLNQFSFVSFFELNEKYLNPMVFDAQNDLITNLFLSSDPSSHTSRYSFSYTFNPLIRMTSMPQVSMDDVTKSEYQVLVNLEIYIQVPQYMISDQLPGSTRSIDNHKQIKGEAIGKLNRSVVSIPCYYDYLYFDLDNGSIREIISIDSSNVDSLTNRMISNGRLSNGDSYSIGAQYIGHGTDFNYSITYNGELLTGNGTLFVYNDNTAICRLGGDLIGNILTPVLSEAQRTLSGIMLGSSKIEMLDNIPVVLDLSWFRKHPSISNIKLVPANWTIRHPAIRDLYSVATDVNAYRSSLNFNDTMVVSLQIIEISNRGITRFTLASPYPLLPDGSFSLQITLPVSFTVSGKFNKQTSFIENIISSDPLYDILTLNVIPTWDYLPYGSVQVDNVNFDIGGISNTAIPSTASHDAFIDKVGMLDTSYVTIYSTLPYQIINNQIKFSLHISEDLTILDPYRINKTYELYFIHSGVYYSSVNRSSFTVDLTSSIPTDLVFAATEDFRLRVLDNITKYSPLYFGVIIIP